MIRIQAGEHDLVAPLFARYFDRIFAYLRSLTDRPADAEDVTQQVFAAALEALPRFEVRAHSSFRSWIFAIAHNMAMKHRRAAERAVPLPPEDLNLHAERVDCTRPQEPAAGLGWLRDADLANALRRLPDLPREVILLRYAGDLSLTEIAAMIGVSEDSVKQAHRRALRSLRERLVRLNRLR